MIAVALETFPPGHLSSMRRLLQRRLGRSCRGFHQVAFKKVEFALYKEGKVKPRPIE